MIEVVPAILEKDFSEIEKKIHLVEGLVDWVQIDLADETLVPNTTFLDPEPFRYLTGSTTDYSGSNESFFGDVRQPLFASHKSSSSSLSESLSPKQGKYSKDSLGQTFNAPQKAHSSLDNSTLGSRHPLNFELHMMVQDPLRYLERFATVGFKRFFAHIEGDYLEEYFEGGKKLGVEIGLAIDGPTSPSAILKYLDRLDAVLVMAIVAGESGRPFRGDTLEKIKKIREKDPEIPISVDGAMNPENAKRVVTAGATRINSNSYIFSSPNIEEAINLLELISKPNTSSHSGKPR